MDYFNPKKINLKDHPTLSERWVQDRISENPTILGLGDIVLKDKERIQPKAGRLDLLLQDPETNRRYEVEVQLGKTDEKHIIRTIEYWDIERKRYPQYEHCAVIIAEDITSRFLNVINLFNGNIPLIAIQMTAVEVDNKVGLFFTTVLDETPLGLVEEDEEVQELTDRKYWEQRGTKETVSIADELLRVLHESDPNLNLKYNKMYIGLEKSGNPNNFVIFKPRKNSITIEVRLPKTEELDRQFEESEVDILEYSKRYGRYRIRLVKKDIKVHGDLINHILKKAYETSII
ncbi:DUF5655 domain-containing protein [Alteribacter keqinensis]|uniref:Uncharacterized protein n=1 Tax=Alteribacter keqinensis TaxID=2483800 RepID=A0A3M7TT50_9BACI|nr:DUF5655 domain-containing protein [Alteribacter keqinensis]RNA68808.1 hypothetical protein EBO34_02250 [Alteribacter keqinensis]